MSSVFSDHTSETAEKPRFLTVGFWGRAGVLAVIIGSYLATIAVNISNERALVISEMERLSAVTAASAKTHTEAIFEATVQILSALRSDLGRLDTDAHGQQDLLDDHFFDPTYLRATVILDAEGRMTASSFRDLIGNDASYFPFYQVHKTGGPDRIYTGDIIVGDVTRAPHFVSSLGRYDSSGEFVGVVAAAYELTYFRDIYRQLVPGPNYGIALYHTEEGLVVASDSDIVPGALPSSSQFPGNVPRGVAEGAQSFRILLDGGETAHTDSLAVGSNGPFFVATMANLDRLLAQHRRASFTKYVLAAIFVLTAVGFAVALEMFLFNRRRAEAEKSALETRLRHAQKMEALGTLAGGLAHDFNNLLSSIIGFGELARDRKDDPAKQQHALEQVLRAGQRAEAMVEQILTFSRRVDPERRPLPVGDVLEEVVELLRVSLPPNLQVHLETDDRSLWTTGNSTQLDQVFMNLCRNAVDAMPEGGLLDIRLDSIELSEAESRQFPRLEPGSYVRVRIKDTGGGIPAEIRERVFDPFFTTKATGRGTGLGLAIAHGIVSAHGGGLDIESDPGSGTRITVCLPRCPPPPAGETAPAVPALDGEGRRILFVDDEAAIVDLAEERLALFGFEPVGFASPAEALDAFREAPETFDLVITDYAMPDMTGLELAKAVWKLRPELPVLLVTGLAPPELRAQAEAAGVAGIIGKPLTADRLAAALAPILAELQAAAGPETRQSSASSRAP